MPPSLLRDFVTVRSLVWFVGLILYVLWVVTLVLCLAQNEDEEHKADSDDVSSNQKFMTYNYHYAMPRPLALYAWSIGQWCYRISPRLSERLTKHAWRSFEHHHYHLQDATTTTTSTAASLLLEMPTIHIQDFVGNETGALQFLKSKYGNDWRERPLLLKGLWDPDTQLCQKKSFERQLSPQGLLQMNLTIPYYLDARIYGALRPDAEAPVQQIVQGMLDGQPHKIGSQLIVQHNPHLMAEVAPLSLVTTLFGDYFTIDRLLGHGRTLGIFPGITTVPLFVANGNATKNTTTLDSSDNDDDNENDQDTCSSNNDNKTASFRNQTTPSTGLHCEPIANVAVQLHGFRKWTLVDPQHSWQLRPAISRDGRSFYPSWVTKLDHAPRYEVISYPGDAVFVPTWTWHRVDYLKECSDLSIGASLFHFRAGDYLRRNPLFAILLVPALVRELAGMSSQ